MSGVCPSLPGPGISVVAALPVGSDLSLIMDKLTMCGFSSQVPVCNVTT